MPKIADGVVFDDDERIAAWVAQRIPEATHGFGNCRAFGILNKNNDLIAGVVFHNFRGHDIEMSAAADDPQWCNRRILRRLFDYAFNGCGVTRMTTITSRSNKRAQKIDKGLGFKVEGLIRKGWSATEDAVVFGMVRDECRWLPKETLNG